MSGSGFAASGRQVHLRHDEQEVTVVEVGGGIRTYTVGGTHVLDGYAAAEMCSGARGQTLVPWPNRIADGRYAFAGRDLQLPLTEPDKHNAIHGLLRWRSWEVAEAAADRAVLTCRLLPSTGYPFAIEARNEYTLDGGGLTVRTVTTNIGPDPCPYGIGFHPYLTVATDRIDDTVLRIPGAAYMPTDDRGIPVDRRPVEGTEYDFREPRQLGGTQIDVAYADLDRDADGRAEVRLADRAGERSVTVWLDRSFPYVEIFTGDALPERDRRRRGLGVEPMTCPPNAFATDTDVLVLDPGGSATTTWGVRPAGF